MGILFGFAPWIVYWVLVGNVPFKAAAVVALAVALAGFAIAAQHRQTGGSLKSALWQRLFVLAVLTFALGEPSGSGGYRRWATRGSSWWRLSAC